jgi:2-polyprenyl-3-methyl-5-hydroxy-6-metoxy-1,4-benzoquinol methylase
MSDKSVYTPWSQEKPDLPWEVTKKIYKDKVHEYVHPGELVEQMFGSRISQIGNMLDVGGGNGVVGEPFFKRHGVKITILDAWWEYPDRPKPDNLVLGNAMDAIKLFGESSFDYVQATEILEHMPKADGRKLIELLKRVTRNLLLFSTPYAYLEQPAIHGNPYQVHVCGWMPQEFEEMGLEVYFNASQMFGGWSKAVDRTLDNQQSQA